MEHLKSLLRIVLIIILFNSCKKHTLIPYHFKGRILNKLSNQPFDIPITLFLSSNNGNYLKLSEDILVNADGTFNIPCKGLEKNVYYFLQIKTDQCTLEPIYISDSREDLFKHNSEDYKISPFSKIHVVIKPLIQQDPNVDHVQCNLSQYNQTNLSWKSKFFYNNKPDSMIYLDPFLTNPNVESELSYTIYYKDGSTIQNSVTKTFEGCFTRIDIPF